MRSMLSLSRCALAACALLSAALCAQAATVSLFGVAGTGTGTPLAVPSGVSDARAAFLVGVTGRLNEEFAPLANLTNVFGNASRISGGAVSLAGGAGRFNTSSDPASAWYDTVSDTTINLSSSQDAFGLYITDYGDFNAFMSLEIWDGASLVYSTNVGALNANGQPVTPTKGNNSVMFFGLHSSVAFNKVVLKLAQSPPDPDCDPTVESCEPIVDVVGLDSMVIGQIDDVGTGVPEPSSLMLAGLGLLAGARALRRRH